MTSNVNDIKWYCANCRVGSAKDTKIEEEIQKIETKEEAIDIQNQAEIPDIYFGDEISNNSEKLRNPYLSALEGSGGQQIEKVMIEFEGLFPPEDNDLNNQHESLF